MTAWSWNIGVPPWDPSAGDQHDFWIVETSSFQATDLATSPPAVAVTSLHPDHLDWHGHEATYFADKLSICTQAEVRQPIVERWTTTCSGQGPSLPDPRSSGSPTTSRTWMATGAG